MKPSNRIHYGRMITDLMDMVERIQEPNLPRCERTFVRSDNQSWQCSRQAKVGAYREELTVCMKCFWEAFA